MTDLTATDDWLTMRSLEERSHIQAQVNRFRQFIDGWQPRPCPPHPEFCPAGGLHEWESDSDDKGFFGRGRSWIACANCGADADGPFYPEEEPE